MNKIVQETEEMYTPLHLVPPSVPGLIASIENKYKINASNIRFLYRFEYFHPMDIP